MPNYCYKLPRSHEQHPWTNYYSNWLYWVSRNAVDHGNKDHGMCKLVCHIKLLLWWRRVGISVQQQIGLMARRVCFVLQGCDYIIKMALKLLVGGDLLAQRLASTYMLTSSLLGCSDNCSDNDHP